MDVIKERAKEFSRTIRMHTLHLEDFDSELSSTLLYINKNSEKLRFLSYLKDIVEKMYQDHAKVCPNPGSCSENKSYEIALYSIQQQYDDYFEMEGGAQLQEKPAMYFFAEGKYFDAFTAIRECVKVAKKSIVLIDGYVDDSTLSFFPAKEPSIPLKILTKAKYFNDATLQRAAELYNRQYGNLIIKKSENYHDRFLIIDDSDFYHIGASIKDAGNKIFMFTRIEDEDIKESVRSKFKTEWGNS